MELADELLAIFAFDLKAFGLDHVLRPWQYRLQVRIADIRLVQVPALLVRDGQHRAERIVRDYGGVHLVCHEGLAKDLGKSLGN